MSVLQPCFAVLLGVCAVLVYFFIADPVLFASNGHINLQQFEKFHGFNLSFYKPERHQGQSLKHNFFEGWYMKLSGKDRTIAVIFGLFKPHLRHKTRMEEAFVMIVDSQSQKCYYISFDVNQFTHNDPKAFNLSIGDNHMTKNHVSLNIDEPEFSIKGSLRISELNGIDTAFPVSPLSLGAMGYYGFVPILECYHGIIMIDGQVEGSLDIRTKEKTSTVAFENAYIEKEFGSNFPTTWLWAQTNSFQNLKTVKRASLSLSVASVPVIGIEKLGFIVGMLVDDDLYMFTPFLGSKIVNFSFVNDTDGKVMGADIELRTGAVKLQVEIRVPHPGVGPLLYSPSLTEHKMVPRVTEYLDGETRVSLYKNDELIFDGQGINTGVEMEGVVTLLTQMSSL